MLDFGHGLLHEGLSAKAGNDGHDEEEVDLVEVGLYRGEGGGGIEDETSLDPGFAGATEGRGNVVISLDVDGNEVGPGFDEAGQVVIGPGNHEVDVEKDVVGGVDGGDHGRAEGNVVHEVPIHDVEVHPIGSGVDGTGSFLRDSTEIGGEERGGDDAVLVSARDHKEEFECGMRIWEWGNLRRDRIESNFG